MNHWTITSSGEVKPSSTFQIDKKGIVQIPKEVEGVPVRSLASNAFMGRENICYVFAPETLKSIGVRSFMGCKRLVAFSVPERVDTIGEEAFMGCSNLISIHIPESVSVICDRAFYGCDALQLKNSVITDKFGAGVFPETVLHKLAEVATTGIENSSHTDTESHHTGGTVTIVEEGSIHTGEVTETVPAPVEETPSPNVEEASAPAEETPKPARTPKAKRVTSSSKRPARKKSTTSGG